MQKIFYVSRNEDKAHDGKAPDMDRFQRVEKLNSLIAAGVPPTSSPGLSTNL